MIKMVVLHGQYQVFGRVVYSDNKTQGAWGDQTDAASAPNATSALAGLPNATFYSEFNMVMTNGTSAHDHEIYDFTLSDSQCQINTTTVYNGTATITMRRGPVPNVPQYKNS